MNKLEEILKDLLGVEAKLVKTTTYSQQYGTPDDYDFNLLVDQDVIGQLLARGTKWQCWKFKKSEDTSQDEITINTAIEGEIEKLITWWC